MSLLALIAALLLEQFYPLRSRQHLLLGFTRFANLLERKLNGGEHTHGVLAWSIAVLPATLIAGGVAWLLHHYVGNLAALGWSMLILYTTMGFRVFSSAFSGIARALQADELVEARTLLAEWTNQSSSELTKDEIAKVAIEQGLIDSHRFVFGTIFWFMVLGPAGAVLYRLTTRLYEKWGARAERLDDVFGRFSARAFTILDWLPVRLTSVSFAIVGNFEDAVYCWRSQAAHWSNYAYGILLASGAGALGVRLGEPLHQDHTVKFRPELGIGDDANPAYLNSAVGLIWRSVLLWLMLILLFWLAHRV